MTDTPDLELFAYWRTSATYRVRVALNLKGLVARERFVDTERSTNGSGARWIRCIIAPAPAGWAPRRIRWRWWMPAWPCAVSKGCT